MNKNMPLQLAIENSKKELVDFINELSNKYNLSFYLLEIISKEIYQEIVKNKQIELEQVKKQYETQLQKEKEVKEDGNRRNNNDNNKHGKN